MINTFDSITNFLNLFPANPFSDFINGGLLLVRRNWLNQAPTVNPYEFAVKANGQLVGTLDAVDPEGATLTYVLKTAPLHGSVTVGADGLWTYSPGPAYAYGEPESFTVAVSDGGYNIFMPTTREVTVPVAMVDFTNTFRVENLTPHDLRLEKIEYSERFAQLKKAPPIGYLVSPGESVAFTIRHSGGYSMARFEFRDPSNPAATYGAQADLPNTNFVKDKFTGCFGTSSSCLIPESNNRTVLFGDAPGAVVLYPTDKNAKEWLSNLQNVAGSGVGGLSVKYLDGVTVTPRNDLKSVSGAYKYITNPTGNAGVTQAIQLSTTVTTQETKSWEVEAQVSLEMMKVLTGTLRGQYGEAYTLSTAKTESTTVTQTAKPYSFLAVSAAAPVIEVAGDLQFKFAGVGPTYTFKDVNYYVPDQRANPGEFGGVTVIQEPLSSEGVWLVDERAALIRQPVYKVGDQAQLDFYGFTTGPVGGGVWSPGTENLTNRTNTVFASSNPAVATVSDTGGIIAVGAGTATIRAQYSWGPIQVSSNPYNAQSGEVVGTVSVTVNPA